MATTFTRRVNVTPSRGVDRRYARSTTEHWVVRYTDHSGIQREFTHYGPDSVKQRLESMGVAFDSNVDVEFRR